MQHSLANPFVPQATVMQNLSYVKIGPTSVDALAHPTTTITAMMVMQHVVSHHGIFSPFRRCVASRIQHSLANPFVPQATVMQHVSHHRNPGSKVCCIADATNTHSASRY
jgi:hypothetical protein